MKKINWEKLLDKWFEKVMKKHNVAIEKYEELSSEKQYNFKCGYSKGYADGLMMATSILNRMENKAKKRRDVMKSLQEKQLELDSFIIEKRGLTEDKISTSELMKNMILGCYDEIEEVAEDIENPEEWIDILHFVLSIANYMNLELVDQTLVEDRKIILSTELHNIRLDFKLFLRASRCFKHWSDKPSNMRDVIIHLSNMIYDIKSACKALGVDMVEEYDKKYEINIQRQMEGY